MPEIYPQTNSNRIEIIDVLRGFALLGVLLVHITGEFAGWSSLYIDPHKMTELSTAKTDSAVNFGIYLFFTAKSRALFSFLFGVGFFFQLKKASRNNTNIKQRFIKRMVVLFLLGALHAYLLWSGDVLRVYSICGLCLLAVYKQKQNVLLFAGIFFTIILPAINTIIKMYIPHNAVTPLMQQTMYNGYSASDYSGLIYANLARDKAFNLDPFSIGGFYFVILGNFILGFWAAKKDLFTKLLSDEKLTKKILWITFITGAFCSAQFMRLLTIVFHIPTSLPIILRQLLAFTEAYSYQALACFTLCFIIHLYKIKIIKNWLLYLIPVGKMTLTNYIMQSVLAVVLFFGVGFGLFGKYGSSVTLVIGILFYLVQVWFSKIWLLNFSMGPVEFLWRSALEGKWQKLKKNTKSA